MSRFRAIPYEDQSEINLSPMLDVIFIMLIFFIVVATFIDEDGLSVMLPSGLEQQNNDIESINVIVESGSTFNVNGRVMSGSSVRPYVQALFAENPKASFGVLLADGTVVKDAVVAIEAGRSIGLDIVPIMSTE